MSYFCLVCVINGEDFFFTELKDHKLHFDNDVALAALGSLEEVRALQEIAYKVAPEYGLLEIVEIAVEN